MTRIPPYSIGSSEWPGLAKVLEEMGELQQVMGKLMALGEENYNHWDGSDLRARLEEEIADVLAALCFFIQQNSPTLRSTVILDRKHDKMMLFQRWHRDSWRASDSKFTK